MGRLQGKVAVITGGSRGIGAATARLFVKEGAGAVIADILAEEGAALVEEIQRAGGNAEFVRCDVTRSDEMKRVMTTAVECFGKLDILFNNAGIVNDMIGIANYPEEIFDRVMAVNIKGCFLGLKHAVPEMLKAGGGSIILRKADMIIEFFEYRRPEPKPRNPEARVCDHGYTHICLQVEDIDQEYERLKASGMTFHAAPPPGEPGGLRAIYGKDPDGNVVELMEELPG